MLYKVNNRKIIVEQRNLHFIYIWICYELLTIFVHLKTKLQNFVDSSLFLAKHSLRFRV